MSIEDIQGTLKAINNLLGDIKEELSNLPGTKHKDLLGQWKILDSSVGTAHNAVGRLQQLTSKEKKW